MVKLVRVAVLVALLAGSPAARASAGPDLGMPPFPTATDDGSAMLWLKNHTSLGVGSFVAFGADNVLVVLTDEVSTRSPTIHRISFRQEAIKVEFVARTGGRSLRGSGEVDCAAGTFRAETVELFSGSDLRGERITGEGPAAVGRVPRAGSAPAIAAAQVCAGDNSAFAPLANTARRLPAPPPAPAAAPAASSARAPALLAPPTPLPPPAAPRLPAAAGETETFAQIGAFGSREAAERAWSRLAELFPDVMAGKTMRIEPVAVNGTTMYRSSVAGFAGQVDAQALCSRLMASSETCFVRH
ncbi:MAG TPA: SPOR domain-containing protein [Caulobacteraceae bacterium]|jgi:hypothetical protein|nr:SPOR domain-containing protein [Caulobacteraceae bacterium]